jgi:hypothetical protein
MKRYFSKILNILLIIVLVVTLVGCGKKTPPQAPDLLTDVSKRTFNYFWEFAHPETGLVLDKYIDQAVASIAATGFGLAALPIGVEKGWITRAQGKERARKTLNSFASGLVEGKNGFFMHWVNRRTGKGMWDREISSIDTALFIAGAIVAGEYFDGEIKERAEDLYKAIDWPWMTDGGVTLRMGWTEEKGFTNDRWGDRFDEGLLATLLAMGSPTHPISPAAWDEIDRSVEHTNPYTDETHIALKAETLFVYQFPLIFFDLRDTTDGHGIDYFENAVKATKYNRDYTMKTHVDRYGVYGEVWGLSAEDKPYSGYHAYGARELNEDGTIAPYASVSALPFLPEEAMASIKAMVNNFPRVYDKYGFHAGFNLIHEWVEELGPWYSQNYIGIDQGAILLSIANYQSELVWKYFMKNPYVLEALKRAGFDKYQ